MQYWWLCLDKSTNVWQYLERCIPLLIQQNVDGSTDFFNRSWEEFKVEFNDSRGNYWLGNELLHQLTSTGRYKLRIDLQARGNLSWYYAEYSGFLVLSKQTNYLLRVHGYSGNVGVDAFGTYHNNMMFTTYDRDNDQWTNSDSNNNCAVAHGGGFWYKDCGHGAVNSVRRRFWWSTGGLILQSTRMWLLCR